jgi:hypothetical protein
MPAPPHLAAKPRGALESPRVLRGVKKLFLQVVPVVSLYTIFYENNSQ